MAETEEQPQFEGANFDGANFQDETGEAKEASEFFDGFEDREPSEQAES